MMPLVNSDSISQFHRGIIYPYPAISFATLPSFAPGKYPRQPLCSVPLKFSMG
jgi:hypothetical protein